MSNYYIESSEDIDKNAIVLTFQNIISNPVVRNQFKKMVIGKEGLTENKVKLGISFCLIFHLMGTIHKNKINIHTDSQFVQEILKFQMARNNAIKHLVGLKANKGIYFQDYKYLIVCHSSFGIIGEISDVPIERLKDTENMVYVLGKDCAKLWASFDLLVEKYSQFANAS